MRTLLWRILSAVVANQGAVQLTEETAANPEVAAILDFLIEQGWLEEGHPVGMCVVTPIGRLWVEGVVHGYSLKFYEYGGKTFLLDWRNRTTMCGTGQVRDDQRRTRMVFRTLRSQIGEGNDYDIRRPRHGKGSRNRVLPTGGRS